MKFLVEALVEWVYGTLFFVSAFVTVVGATSFQIESLQSTTGLFYVGSVAVFIACVGILVVRLTRGG